MFLDDLNIRCKDIELEFSLIVEWSSREDCVCGTEGRSIRRRGGGDSLTSSLVWGSVMRSDGAPGVVTQWADSEETKSSFLFDFRDVLY